MSDPTTPRLHFATQLYRPRRQADGPRLLAALVSNLQLPFVTGATIFLDDCEPPWHRPEVRFVRLNRRATYADFLELMQAGTAKPKVSPTHLLFANSDIIFDDGIARAAAALTRPDWAICLTRRERDGSYPPGIEPLQTQDAWLLARQRPDPLLLDQLRAIRLGVAGCEHLYAAALVAHGFNLWNPCEDCRATHTDPDPVAYAPDGERYWGLYAYVPPCRIEAVGRQEPEIFFAYAHAPGRYYPVRLG
jgi:hypothetical protein